MTNTQLTSPTNTAVQAADLYREIHKGIRFALFHAILHSGRVDGTDGDDIDALLSRCTDLVELLELHHHHEDVFVQPFIVRAAPDLAVAVDAQHAEVEAGMIALRRIGERLATAAAPDRPIVAHELYLYLCRFTALYLDHQAVEETEVMPALLAAVPAAELNDMHATLRQSIPPDVMADCMSVMLPAMNIEERVEMLAGMSMAPPPVWAILRRAAKAALSADDFAIVAARIGMN